MKERRRVLGISQEGLAARSGLHWTYVGKVERGEVNARLHNLLKIAVGLDMDPGELLQGLKPPPDSDAPDSDPPDSDAPDSDPPDSDAPDLDLDRSAAT